MDGFGIKTQKVPGVHYFAPLPDSCQGPFVVVSPINGRVDSLERLWNLLTMDPWFGSTTIVFTGNYLAGPDAKKLISLLCTLRMSHPSPIFLAGPQDLAAAAYLGLLKNLELQVALLAVGTSWAEAGGDVFASYGVTSNCATDLVHAMPPEHREFLTDLAVSIKHPDKVAADAPTSSYARDLFAISPPLSDPTHIQTAVAAPSALSPMPTMARGSDAASLDGVEEHVHIRFSRDLREELASQVRIDDMDGVVSTERPQVEKRLPQDQRRPNSKFPAINADGAAVNGDGQLSALFYPNGHVLVAPA